MSTPPVGLSGDAPRQAVVGSRRLATPVTFKQGGAVNAPSYPRIVAPAIAADCSFQTVRDRTIHPSCSLTHRLATVGRGF